MEEKNKVITEAVDGMLKEGQFIASANQVKQKVKKDKDVEVSRQAVRKVLKEDLGLRYRKIKKIPV